MFAITQPVVRIVRPEAQARPYLSRALNDGGNLCEQPALMQPARVRATC
jgi:hypothetical protein